MSAAAKGPGVVRLGDDVRRAIDPTALENDLTRLWKRAAEDGSTVSRACLANIIVALPAGGDATELVEDITRIHPSRVILVRPDPGRRPGEVEAWVSATCSRGDGDVLVCCESITLELGPGGERAVPNAVRSLVVGDLRRVVLVEHVAWREVVWIEDLGRSVDLVLADGATLGPGDTLELWRRCAREEGPRSYRELVWTRLADWRRAVAVGFDDLAREAFAAIADVRITVSQDTGAIPGALLLAGWMASRLGWKAEAGTADALRREDGSTVALAVETVPRGKDPARIREVTVGFGDAAPRRAWKRRSAERAIDVWVEGESEPRARFNRLKTSRASAVVREMHRRHGDPRAVEAMEIAGVLLRAITPR